MLNRPKARTRGYSCPLDENVARSILHKTIAIESKMIHQSYQTAQNEASQGFRKKNEPEPKNGSSPTASSQWFGEQCESEPNAQGALTKLKERSEFAPNPAAAPRVQTAKLIRAQRSKSKANLSKRPKGVNRNSGHAPANQRAAPWRVQLT